MGMIAMRLRGGIRRMERAQAFAPLREGGCRPVEGSAVGLSLRGKWKGRRGEYCGWPSMPASALAIRKGLDSFVAGVEPRLPRRPPAVLPPSRPLPLVFCHTRTSHPWPRHPPLGGGGRVLSPPLLLVFAKSQRVSTKCHDEPEIPRAPDGSPTVKTRKTPMFSIISRPLRPLPRRRFPPAAGLPLRPWGGLRGPAPPMGPPRGKEKSGFGGGGRVR